MKINFRSTVIVIVSLVIALFGFVATYVVYGYTHDIMDEITSERLESTALNTTDDYSSIFARIQLTVQNMAEDSEVVNFILDSNEDAEMMLLHKLEYFSPTTFFDAVYLINTDGDTILSTEPSFLGKNYGFREYFQKAIIGNGYTSILLGVTSGKRGYYFSEPVFNNEKVIGVLVIKMSEEFLSGLTALSPEDDQTKYLIVNDHGVIVFSNNENDLYKSLGILSDEQVEYEKEYRFPGLEFEELGYEDIQNALINMPDEIQMFELSVEEKQTAEQIALVRIPETDLYSIVIFDLQPYREVAESIAMIIAIFVSLAALSAVILIFIFMLILSRSFKRLVVMADKIKAGDYSTRISKASWFGDIDSLIKAVNGMIETIQASQEKTKEKVEEQTRELEQRGIYLERQQKAMVNILDDVETEKERYKEQVLETKKFVMAVENANEHIVITDPEGMTLYANPQVQSITGFTNQEVLGTKAGKLWGGLMQKSFYKKLWKVIKEEKKTFSGELKNKRKSGEEYIAYANISPILDENGEVQFFVGIERDITIEKQIDKAKTEFVSLASHQLRTPLSSINWYTEMLISGDAGKVSEEQEVYLKQVYASSQRMVELVNALLNVSRLELGTFMIEPVKTNIKDLAETVINELKPIVESREQKLKTTFDSKLPEVLVDPKLMTIIFQNLLSNAVKYSPEKEVIELNVTKQEKDFLVTVKDNGYGIPKGQQEKIFTKMFRADNVRQLETEGTGLGLYLVKSIIEHIGGSIRFESKEGEGTTFFVTIPLKGMKKKKGTKELS